MLVPEDWKAAKAKVIQAPQDLLDSQVYFNNTFELLLSDSLLQGDSSRNACFAFCLHHRGFRSSWLGWNRPTWQPGNSRKTRTTGWSGQTGQSGTSRHLRHFLMLPDIRAEGTLQERSQHVMLITERRMLLKTHTEPAGLQISRVDGGPGLWLNSQSYNLVRELPYCSNDTLECPDCGFWYTSGKMRDSGEHFKQLPPL